MKKHILILLFLSFSLAGFLCMQIGIFSRLLWRASGKNRVLINLSLGEYQRCSLQLIRRCKFQQVF